VAKHLIDVDEPALDAARVSARHDDYQGHRERSPCRATHGRAERVAQALDVLSNARLDDREQAWR
jgi:hypothetical protein